MHVDVHVVKAGHMGVFSLVDSRFSRLVKKGTVWTMRACFNPWDMIWQCAQCFRKVAKDELKPCVRRASAG